jgi:ADP-ribosylglycohydrolase
MMENQSDSPSARARISLEGLSCGDAFGENFFFYTETPESLSQTRTLPAAPWYFTDDTLMACSVLSVLCQRGEVDQNLLAKSFADNFDPRRGYGAGMYSLLEQIRNGKPWSEAACSLFKGQGSFGNGSAMRVAPLGAFFADNLSKVAEQAELSSLVTHTHPEAIAGAVAVAVAAAVAWDYRSSNSAPRPDKFLHKVLGQVPKSKVRAGIVSACDLDPNTSVQEAAQVLGNGAEISAPDTIPFALWCAAQHLDNYEEALWLTVRGRGDIDTNCAIVGGITVMFTGAAGIPQLWRESREGPPDALTGL